MSPGRAPGLGSAGGLVPAGAARLKLSMRGRTDPVCAATGAMEIKAKIDGVNLNPDNSEQQAVDCVNTVSLDPRHEGGDRGGQRMRKSRQRKQKETSCLGNSSSTPHLTPTADPQPTHPP